MIKKDYDKKAVRKDQIERVVVRLTMQHVMDEEKINRLIDAILVMQEQEDITTPALRSQLAETESSIGNILKAIEQGIFTPSTKQRLDELEARKEEILANIQTAELQKIGVNVNQIARRVNSTGSVYQEDIDEIKGVLNEIWRLQRLSLLKAR